MAHKNRRSPPRRWSQAHSFKPAKEPPRRGISVSWPFNVAGSFPSRGAPFLPARRFLPTDSLIGESTWRWLSSPAILAGRRRWWSADDTLCIARGTRLRDPKRWSRGGREICQELSKDEAFQWSNDPGEEFVRARDSTVGEKLILGY